MATPTKPIFGQAKDVFHAAVGGRPTTNPEKLRNDPAGRAAYDAKVSDWEARAASFISQTEKEISAMSVRLNPQARAVIGPAPEASIKLPIVRGPQLVMHKLRMEKALAAGPAPAPIATKPAQVITVSQIGRAVVATATHADPAISTPAKAHLDGIIGLAARLGLSSSPTCSKAEFDSLTPRQKMEFCKKGGRIEAEPAAAAPAIKPGAKTITRAQLREHIPAREQAAFFRSGGTLTD